MENNIDKKDIEEYVKNARKEGHSDEAIRFSLEESGHKSEVVDEYLYKKKKDVSRIIIGISIFLLAASLTLYISMNISFGEGNEELNDQIVLETPTTRLNEVLLSGDRGGCVDVNDNLLKDACNEYFSPKDEECDAGCMDRRMLSIAMVNGSIEHCETISDNYIKSLCQNMTGEHNNE